MIKRFAYLLCATVLCLTLHAECYSIIFNCGTADSSSPTTDLAAIVRSATDNCITGIRTANKIYRAAEGFGIKGGTGSIKGELTLQLDTTYAISEMIVFAAAYNGKDSAQNKSIQINGQNIYWEEGHRTEIYAYHISCNGETDSICISSNVSNNNRWYIQQIDFIAPEPRPYHAQITSPYLIDLGTALIIEGQPTTDVNDISVTARSTNGDSLRVRIQSGQYYSVSPNALPCTGGEIDISYTVSAQRSYYDTLCIEGTGLDKQKTVRAIPLKLYARTHSTPTINVDSSCMHIGPMPCDYYQPAQGLCDSLLKSTLGEIIDCGVRYKYGSGERHTWDGFYHTDRDTNTNQVLDMYSNNVRYFDPTNSYSSVSEYDIEHMLPKSWWGGNVNKAFCDLYHLAPGDYSANRSKSNHAPGIPTDSTFDNGSFVTGDGSQYGLKRVFCPADEYKGDFARAYFYIATCYGDSLQWVETGEAGQAMTNNSYQEFQPWLRDLLMDWHRLDPVSDKEKARAIEVNKIQGNRNPFIDYPELAEYIWGTEQGKHVNFYSLTQSFGDEYEAFDQLQNTLPHYKTKGKENVYKVLNDGRIIIVKDGVHYTVLGLKSTK